MKKILAFMLAMLMLLATVSCGGNNDIVDESTADTTTPATTDAATESDTETTGDPYTFTGDFKVGFARVDITPEGDIPLNTGDMLTKVKEELYATCVAISDGKNTVLLYSLDIKNMTPDFDNTVKTRIKTATKIPPENIIINTMHNHSAPSTNVPGNSTAVRKWSNELATTMATMAKDAVADLSDAVPYIGTGKTTNLAFVRRYFHEDGSFSSMVGYRGKSTTPVVRHESEADDVVQLIRFVREDKKDVVMANWQAHVAHAIGQFPNTISGDYVYYARNTVESGDDDALFAFFLGAAGNINLKVAIKELDRAGGNYLFVGKQLGQEILKGLENMTPVNGGEVKGINRIYQAERRPSTTEEADRARLVKNSGYAEDTDEYNALLDKYGFKSKYEVNYTISRENKTGTQSMKLGAMTIGDISFVSVPYEMFDTNGMEIKAATPDKMTFILAYSGGAFGYIPSALAVPNGGYEVYVSGYEYGTAEKVVAELLEMLREIVK